MLVPVSKWNREMKSRNSFDVTFRFCRWISPGDDGSVNGGEDDDDEFECNPLPALIKGRWERRIAPILFDGSFVDRIG